MSSAFYVTTIVFSHVNRRLSSQQNKYPVIIADVTKMIKIEKSCKKGKKSAPSTNVGDAQDRGEGKKACRLFHTHPSGCVMSRSSVWVTVTPKTNNTQIRRVQSGTSVAEGNSKKKKFFVCVNLRVFPSSHTEKLPFSDIFLLFVCQFVVLIRNLRTRLFKSLLPRATQIPRSRQRSSSTDDCRLGTRQKKKLLQKKKSSS